MTDTRIVLVKPGDVLIFGNVGEVSPEALLAGSSALVALKESLGLGEVVLFSGDIDLAAVTPAQSAPPAVPAQGSEALAKASAVTERE